MQVIKGTEHADSATLGRRANLEGRSSFQGPVQVYVSAGGTSSRRKTSVAELDRCGVGLCAGDSRLGLLQIR